MIRNTVPRANPSEALVSFLHRHRNLWDGRSQLPGISEEIPPLLEIDTFWHRSQERSHTNASRGEPRNAPRPQRPVTCPNGRQAQRPDFENVRVYGFTRRTHRRNRQPQYQTAGGPKPLCRLGTYPKFSSAKICPPAWKSKLLAVESRLAPAGALTPGMNAQQLKHLEWTPAESSIILGQRSRRAGREEPARAITDTSPGGTRP